MERYALAIIAIIIAFILLKRFVGCLFRIVITLILLAVLAYIYLYMQGSNP
ncbi:MAG: hypothetical protein IJ183_03090 [Prevotella sp.]|nr:hypothetical protein [Prevotella sp.]MBQ9236882.1 hypothetical protein [Prevotella sp.]MBR1840145.1 hypothetical protein [Prevotella sp.]